MRDFPLVNHVERPARDAESIASVTDLMRIIEKKDPHIEALRESRRKCSQQIHQNILSIRRGNWEVKTYTPPTFIPYAPRYFPVSIDRHGRLLSESAQDHPHLSPDRGTNTVPLTIGDLQAAAEWGWVADLAPGRRRQEIDNRWRAQIESAHYHALLRQMYVARMLYNDQLWNTFDAINEAQASRSPWQDYLNDTRLQTQPLRTEEIESALQKPPMVAERVVFTMAARLGAHASPRFDAWKTRTGVDRYEHLDMLLQVQSKNGPTLVGIDVTTDCNPQAIDRKKEQQHIRTKRKTLLENPGNNWEPTPIHRTVLVTPPMIRWGQLLQTWESQRSNTALTPDACLTPIDRKELARRLLGRIYTPHGRPYYQPNEQLATYYAAYRYQDEQADSKQYNQWMRASAK